MFLMEDFDHKLSSLIVQSLGKFPIGYSEKVHIQQFNFMKKYMVTLKIMENLKVARKYNLSYSIN